MKFVQKIEKKMTAVGLDTVCYFSEITAENYTFIVTTINSIGPSSTAPLVVETNPDLPTINPGSYTALGGNYVLSWAPVGLDSIQITARTTGQGWIGFGLGIGQGMVIFSVLFINFFRFFCDFFVFSEILEFFVDL